MSSPLSSTTRSSNMSLLLDLSADPASVKLFLNKKKSLEIKTFIHELLKEKNWEASHTIVLKSLLNHPLAAYNDYSLLLDYLCSQKNYTYISLMFSINEALFKKHIFNIEHSILKRITSKDLSQRLSFEEMETVLKLTFISNTTKSGCLTSVVEMQTLFEHLLENMKLTSELAKIFIENNSMKVNYRFFNIVISYGIRYQKDIYMYQAVLREFLEKNAIDFLMTSSYTLIDFMFSEDNYMALNILDDVMENSIESIIVKNAKESIDKFCIKKMKKCSDEDLLCLMKISTKKDVKTRIMQESYLRKLKK